MSRPLLCVLLRADAVAVECDFRPVGKFLAAKRSSVHRGVFPGLDSTLGRGMTRGSRNPNRS